MGSMTKATLPALFASQKALEGAMRLLLTLERPSPVVDEAVRVLREGLTEAQLKQAIRLKEKEG